MKLKFKQQQYQTEATMAVVNCFDGQSKGERKDIVGRKVVDKGLFGKGAYGKEIEIEEIFSNKKLELSEEEILKNVHEIQKEQGLKTTGVVESYKGYLDQRGIPNIG